MRNGNKQNCVLYVCNQDFWVILGTAYPGLAPGMGPTVRSRVQEVSPASRPLGYSQQTLLRIDPIYPPAAPEKASNPSVTAASRPAGKGREVGVCGGALEGLDGGIV